MRSERSIGWRRSWKRCYDFFHIRYENSIFHNAVLRLNISSNMIVVLLIRAVYSATFVGSCILFHGAIVCPFSDVDEFDRL